MKAVLNLPKNLTLKTKKESEGSEVSGQSPIYLAFQRQLSNTFKQVKEDLIKVKPTELENKLEPELDDPSAKAAKFWRGGAVG